MENSTGFYSTDSVVNTVTELVNGADLWDWISIAAGVGLFLAGSAFWQATRRLRIENDYFTTPGKATHHQNHYTLLPTYLTILVFLAGLTAFIAQSPVSEFIFWISYAAVGLGQLTGLGQRMGVQLVKLVDAVFGTGYRTAHS
ncbi:hypothetical protein JYG30_18315 [Fibrella sp. USSR17]